MPLVGFSDPPAAERKMNVSNSIYTAFENCKKIGLDPLPIPNEDGHPTKGPKIPGICLPA
jgi:hypothetical protein